MTLTLNLTDEQVVRLSRYADVSGKSLETVVADLLQTLPDEPSLAAPRVPGLGAGNVLFLADDFDAELPDTFWFPDEHEGEQGQ